MTVPTMLAEALAYAAQGWRVFPCHTPIFEDGAPARCSCGSAQCGAIGKHPRTKNGFQDATTSEVTLRYWWGVWPDANIGGIPASAGLVAFDLDTDAAETAARRLGLFAEPTMEVQTGNGTHRYFQLPSGLTSGATIGGIVVRSAHGYVLLPPSLHASGRRYALIDAAQPAIPLPPTALEAAKQISSKAGSRQRVLSAVTGESIAEGGRHPALLSIAGHLAASHVPEDIAVQLVQDANLARCVPPKPKDEVANIVNFAYNKEREKNGETARELVLQLAPTTPAITLMTEAPVANPLEAPLPGVLETMAQWSLDTAASPVRTYAVAAALALGSVICARRYTTDAGNYSSLYFMVVGGSGTGKEHVRSTIDRVLTAANATGLLGPNGWTSSSAVYSALRQAPQHVAVIDEFGHVLGAASGSGDGAAMKDTVFTTLMELFGRLHTNARPNQFSTLTLTKKQRAQQEDRSIERPALTATGLTTEETFYAALKHSRITSGFLNRFLVLEDDVQPGELAFGTFTDVPESVVQWVQQILAPHADMDLLNRATSIGPARVLAFHADATECFRTFRRDCNARSAALKAEHLTEMPMRANEQAMRLSLVAALAEDPTTRTIEVRHAEWAIGVVRYLLERLIRTVQSRMSDNPVHALRLKFLECLRKAGARGLSQAEVARARVFYGSTKRDREDAVTWVIEGQHASWVTLLHSGAGRPRRALILANHVEQLQQLSLLATAS